MNWTRLPILGICFAVALTTHALGQAAAPRLGTSTTPAQPPSSSAAPDRTTASFGDWVLRCDRRADVTPPQRFCEVGQSVQRQGDAGPQAQLALGRILPADPIRMTLLLPINVAFEKPPKLTGDTASLDLTWVRCLPTGCFANAVVSDDLLRKLRLVKDLGRMEYRDGTGRDVVLSISFRGFSEALDAFVTESAK
jgi:invasion protein IalB